MVTNQWHPQDLGGRLSRALLVHAWWLHNHTSFHSLEDTNQHSNNLPPKPVMLCILIECRVELNHRLHAAIRAEPARRKQPEAENFCPRKKSAQTQINGNIIHFAKINCTTLTPFTEQPLNNSKQAEIKDKAGWKINETMCCGTWWYARQNSETNRNASNNNNKRKTIVKFFICLPMLLGKETILFLLGQVP